MLSFRLSCKVDNSNMINHIGQHI